MNRLRVLRRTANQIDSSLLSNDGYETAMDDTMGTSASVSMYYSLNDSQISMDKTLEAANDTEAAVDQSMEVAIAATVPPLGRSILTPIAASETTRNYLSPKKGRNQRKSLTSTPLKPVSSVEMFNSPKEQSFHTVRKLDRIASAENVAPDCVEAVEAVDAVEVVSSVSTTSAEVLASAEDSQTADSSAVTIVAAAVAATEQSPAAAQELTGVELMDVSVVDVEMAATIAETVDSSRATQTQAADTEEKQQQTDVKPAIGGGARRKSLTAAFRQLPGGGRRGLVAARGALGSIGENEATTSDDQSSNSPGDQSAAPTAAAALPRRSMRRSIVATIAAGPVRGSPARPAARRQSLKTITPRKTLAANQRKSIGLSQAVHALAARPKPSTTATDAAPAARGRRSMASVVIAAVAAAKTASPVRAAVVRARKSMAPVLPTATAARTAGPGARRSMAAAPRATAGTPRKVIATSAAAVLALNPSRRRVSLQPMTPGRRMATLAAQKPRTPLRPRVPAVRQAPQQQQQQQQQQLQLAPPITASVIAGALSRRRSVMPFPAAAATAPAPAASSASASASATNYHQCPHCAKTFLQPSRLATHMRLHGPAAASASASTTCQHCDRSFDKAHALQRHQLEHCTKIAVGERRRLLQQRDIADRAAAGGKETMATAAAGSRLPRPQIAAATAAQRTTRVQRRMSPSRAHSGVYQTPNKMIKCNECARQFADPLSFALHAKTHRADN